MNFSHKARLAPSHSHLKISHTLLMICSFIFLVEINFLSLYRPKNIMEMFHGKWNIGLLIFSLLPFSFIEYSVSKC